MAEILPLPRRRNGLQQSEGSEQLHRNHDEIDNPEVESGENGDCERGEGIGERAGEIGEQGDQTDLE